MSKYSLFGININPKATHNKNNILKDKISGKFSNSFLKKYY